MRFNCAESLNLSPKANSMSSEPSPLRAFKPCGASERRRPNSGEGALPNDRPKRLRVGLETRTLSSSIRGRRCAFSTSDSLRLRDSPESPCSVIRSEETFSRAEFSSNRQTPNKFRRRIASKLFCVSSRTLSRQGRHMMTSSAKTQSKTATSSAAESSYLSASDTGPTASPAAAPKYACSLASAAVAAPTSSKEWSTCILPASSRSTTAAVTGCLRARGGGRAAFAASTACAPPASVMSATMARISFGSEVSTSRVTLCDRAGNVLVSKISAAPAISKDSRLRGSHNRSTPLGALVKTQSLSSGEISWRL
mmetsp:Transcript_5366/g.16967  ORF Transcript_5366/g.16967 Transcript_5366/m.16967 type:complete len:310 (-) Transcript_5366:123-1052(-)